MANKVNVNTIYVDSTGDLVTNKGCRVAYVLLTATAANAVLVLQDTGTGTPNKFDLRNADSGTTVTFDLSNMPAFFPNGIKASTVTNAIATIIYTNVGGA